MTTNLTAIPSESDNTSTDYMELINLPKGEIQLEPKIPTFNNEKLLRQALTHRSYVNDNPDEGEENNERLEFLGDALLNFLSGDYLYRLYPEMSEDQMTRRRAALVDEKQLARFAKDLGLDLRMRLGIGTIKEGGFTNRNLVSSTFEAFIGAYYLDNNCNIEPVRAFIKKLFNSVPESVVVSRSNVDAKNKFQQWVMANIGTSQLPKYETVQAGGESHAPEFLSKVFVGEEKYGEGKGRSKKDAEKSAAEDALAKLRKRGMI